MERQGIMTPPNDEPALCYDCEERPATKDYTRAGETDRLCARCFDRWTAHDALDNHLIHITELKHRGQYDEALACLASILEANRSLDHDKELARSIAAQRAWALYDAGRYAESEEAHKEWAQLGFQDLWHRQLYALGLSDALEAMGRDGEAIPVLEDVLGEEKPYDLKLAMSVLSTLVRVSGKAGRPVDPKWLKVAEAIAKHYSVDLPSAPSPEAAILALEQTIEGRPEPLLERDRSEP